jgi:SAM-dependent methyltransferase
MQYLILQNPGHNRVYYNASENLALAELTIASKRTSQTLENIESFDLSGIRYISFKSANNLSSKDIEIISKLSFFFAFYELKEIDGKPVLFPIAKSNNEYIDAKISSLLKYQGKTNELFTKMMINVALLTSEVEYADSIKLLDPVSGRGTTLFESAVYGFDAYGIEIEPKSVHETQVFFKKFLENERLKHKSDKRQIYSFSKTETVHIQEFKYALNKEDFKSDSKTKTLGLINGNASDAYKYFKKAKFNLIVGDLPYGIFHGNKGEEHSASKTRNPKTFLSESLVEWYKVLKKGGVIVLAWNSFIISKEQLAHVFEDNNFQVLKDAPYSDFEHMVDKSIKRDIIVARKV